MGIFNNSDKYKIGDRVRIKSTLDEGYIVCILGKYYEIEIDGRKTVETYKENEITKIW